MMEDKTKYLDWKRFKVRPSVVVAPSMFFSLDVGSELKLDGTTYMVTSKIVDQMTDGKVIYRVALEEVVTLPHFGRKLTQVFGKLTPTELRDLNRKTPKGSGKTIDDSELRRLATPLDKSSFYEEN